tara:strand:- start:2413 stop:3303 length:891 start_codon:yes stop_codon:yes gene_type:complete
MDKSLERLAENQMRQGISSQQYTVTGANELAILLSDVLNNMQNQMQGMGQGKGQGKGKGKGMGEGEGEGEGFQLPDIIKKQKSLNESMKEGVGKQGKKGEQGSGEGGEGENGQGQNGEGQSGEGNGSDGQNGRNGKGGNNGDGNGGNDGDGEDGDEYNEDLNGELYEIFKQQQQLRQQLQDKLSKEGLDGNGGNLLRQMEQVEQQLLDKGFNERTLEKMLNLQYELLKLDKADFEQGQESRRESTTNNKNYVNTLRLTPEEVKKYFNTTEILNREALPLKPAYKEKVQEYFKEDND